MGQKRGESAIRLGLGTSPNMQNSSFLYRRAEKTRYNNEEFRKIWRMRADNQNGTRKFKILLALLLLFPYSNFSR
jgi:hypothetical protein